MGKLWRRLSAMGEYPRYILRRGLLLTCVMLACVLVIWVYTGGYSYHTHTIYQMAQAIQTGACIVFGASTLGASLLEDVLTA